MKPYGLVVLPIYDTYSKKVSIAVEEMIYRSFTLGETVSQEITK
jgi:hypothetical protein